MTEKPKTKYRLEYWVKGAKYVRTFGSKKQPEKFVKTLSHVSQVEIRSYEERK